LRKLEHAVHSGRLEEVCELAPDAVDPVEIGVIDPLEDQVLADPALARELLPPGRRATRGEEILGGLHAGVGELRRVRGADALDVGQVRHARLPSSSLEPLGTSGPSITRQPAGANTPMAAPLERSSLACGLGWGSLPLGLHLRAGRPQLRKAGSGA